MLFQTIETERLILREMDESDFEAIHTYAQDPEVSKYQPWGPNSEEETWGYLQQVLLLQRQSPRKGFEIAVVLKEENLLIGACSVHVSDAENREGWMGYCYNKAYWGQGYASEAAKAILEFGFRNLGLHRIFATCDPDNIGSARVLEKAGMQREGRLREHKLQKGKWRDSYLYAVLEGEYLAEA